MPPIFGNYCYILPEATGGPSWWITGAVDATHIVFLLQANRSHIPFEAIRNCLLTSVERVEMWRHADGKHFASQNMANFRLSDENVFAQYGADSAFGIAKQKKTNSVVATPTKCLLFWHNISFFVATMVSNTLRD